MKEVLGLKTKRRNKEKIDYDKYYYKALEEALFEKTEN